MENRTNDTNEHGNEQEESAPKRPARGFAAMDPEYQRQIARDGGRIAHERGVAHKWTSEEAREAGRKGGQSGRGRTRSKDAGEEK